MGLPFLVVFHFGRLQFWSSSFFGSGRLHFLGQVIFIFLSQVVFIFWVRSSSFFGPGRLPFFGSGRLHFLGQVVLRHGRPRVNIKIVVIVVTMNLHVLTEAWTEAWDCNQSEARSGVLKKKKMKLKSLTLRLLRES